MNRLWTYHGRFVISEKAAPVHIYWLDVSVLVTCNGSHWFGALSLLEKLTYAKKGRKILLS